MPDTNKHNAPDIKWQAPPATSPRGTRGRWYLISEALRSRPMEWALVAENVASATATFIRKGNYSGFTAGEFEARTVTIPGTNKSDVFARFVGGEPR